MSRAIAKDQTDVADKLFKAGAALDEKDLEKASPELKQALIKAKLARGIKTSTEPTSKK